MEEELDLLELWHIVSRRWKLIITLTLLAAILSGIISIFFIKPKYVASATVMVTRPAEKEQVILYEDIQISRQLANTYQVIAHSRRVLGKVIDQLSLPYTPEVLRGKVKISPVDKTEIITIDVTDEDPRAAALISNQVAETFMIEINDIMNVENVSLIDGATAPLKPVSPRKRLNVAVAAVVGFMASILLALLFHYLDRTIKSPEEIEELLGLTVLGNIPVMEVAQP